ncbi:hypothetical protein BZM27_52720 [Paraburkholderia steynii]|uniref:Transcription regulator PadR N-terminal domain-containing protein n=1 Tax=Paraburkholderia steynii TaxID=1245441 RepID=A0A4V2NFY0_9BURK|nr:hypothetical protein BZM27_52720 [Paraburkholderia steynii]
MIRLMQVLLHAGTTVGGWRAQQLHEVLLTSFGLSDKRYGLNQLRYDLRKKRAHALLARDGNRYAYRLTDKGVKVALLFVLVHSEGLIRTACQQPVSPPPRRQLPARQQTRKGRAQSRRLHTQGYSAPGRGMKLLYSFCHRSKA